MDKKKIIIIAGIAVGVLIIGILVSKILGNVLESAGKKKDDNPDDFPSGTVVNEEDISKAAEKSYEAILKNQFDDGEQAMSAPVFQGKTTSEWEPIVLNPDGSGVYDFEKSPARRKAEKEFGLEYTGNITKDIQSALDIYTARDDAGLGDNIYNYRAGMKETAFAKVKSVKYSKGNLTIKFDTYDIAEEDKGRNDRLQEEEGESRYNPSSAAYAFCEYCLDYIFLFPEYLEDIDTISIKGKGFAPMHCSKRNISCTYMTSGGNLNILWSGKLDEAEP